MPRFGIASTVALACASAGSFACGDGSTGAPPLIAIRWTHEAPAAVAPPATGPERRVIVLLRETAASGGELITLEEGNGRKVEGPFSGAPLTDHAPVVSGTTIVAASKIGKVIGLNLAGEPLFSVPAMPLGPTQPIALAPDGSIRVASTGGVLMGFKPSEGGAELFKSSAGGAITSAPAVAADGTTWVATDTGRLLSFRPDGSQATDVQLNVFASGPSLTPSGAVAIGENDGVRLISANGAPMWRRARGARVIGTRALASGEILAWGEDGILELLSKANGEPVFSFRANGATPAPIYANPIPLEGGQRFAVVDSAGTAYLVERDGTASATLAIGTGPELRELAVGTNDFVLIAAGNKVLGVDFVVEQ